MCSSQVPRASNDAICDADHAPQFANGLFRIFAVQGGDDFARKCYMAAHSRDMDRIESNLPAKKAPCATFELAVRRGYA